MDRLYKRRGWARRAAAKAGRWWIAVEHPYRNGFVIRQMTPAEKARSRMQLNISKMMLQVYTPELIAEILGTSSPLYGRL